MKATLTFNLPEDQEDFARAAKVLDICSFIWEFEQYLRDQRKYEGKDDIDAIWDKWHELKADEGIELDKIYT